MFVAAKFAEHVLTFRTAFNKKEDEYNIERLSTKLNKDKIKFGSDPEFNALVTEQLEKLQDDEWIKEEEKK